MALKTGTGTSAFASNGRVTLSGVGDHAPVFYLFYRVSSNQAFGIGTDSSATFGLYIPQTVKLTQITNF